MMPIRNENLNTDILSLPKKINSPYWSKKRLKDLNKTPYTEKKFKHWENIFYRGEIKIIGKETDLYECKRCHRVLPPAAFTTCNIRQDGAYYLMKSCRECESLNRAERKIVRKNAPPQPERCECCHKKAGTLWGIINLNADHAHETTVFRGWLCGTCNTGMGKLGDNLEGVLQAAIYLENDENKIIETLHKVFSKMFARTNSINDER